MSKDTAAQADVIHLRQNIQDLLHWRVLEAVQTVLEEELSEALGTVRYERSKTRQGYRNGHETRRITTQVGHAGAGGAAWADGRGGRWFA